MKHHQNEIEKQYIKSYIFPPVSTHRRVLSFGKVLQFIRSDTQPFWIKMSVLLLFPKYDWHIMAMTRCSESFFIVLYWDCPLNMSIQRTTDKDRGWSIGWLIELATHFTAEKTIPHIKRKTFRGSAGLYWFIWYFQSQCSCYWRAK